MPILPVEAAASAKQCWRRSEQDFIGRVRGLLVFHRHFQCVLAHPQAPLLHESLACVSWYFLLPESVCLIRGSAFGAAKAARKNARGHLQAACQHRRAARCRSRRKRASRSQSRSLHTFLIGVAPLDGVRHEIVFPHLLSAKYLECFPGALRFPCCLP